MSETFKAFMKRREAAGRDDVTSDSAHIDGLAVAHRSAIAFPPLGASHLEVKDQGCSEALGFWTGFLVASVARGDTSIPMRIRVTEVFRHDGGNWRMIHRHASRTEEP